MLMRSAPSACVIAGEHAGAVGDVHAQALQRAGVRVLALEHPAAVRPTPRRSSARGSPRRPARAPASTCSMPAAVLGERAADRVGVVEEDVDPDARVRARDARHVAQRAAGVRERLVPLDARRAGLVRDDVREHVRHVARQRDEPVVRVGVDRDRRRAERRRRSRARAGAASGSVCATGVRNQVAPSKRPALAFSAPRASEPQIGWPPTKRGEPAAAATTLALVEPTSVTVVVAGARRAPPRPGRAAARSARRRRTRSAPATASSSVAAAVDGAARDGGGERVGIGVPAARPRRRARARRAPTEAPIKPGADDREPRLTHRPV